MRAPAACIRPFQSPKRRAPPIPDGWRIRIRQMSVTAVPVQALSDRASTQCCGGVEEKRAHCGVAAKTNSLDGYHTQVAAGAACAARAADAAQPRLSLDRAGGISVQWRICFGNVDGRHAVIEVPGPRSSRPVAEFTHTPPNAVQAADEMHEAR